MILVEVFWAFAVPAVARVRRSSPGSRPSPAGDLRSALTPAAVRRVDEAAARGRRFFDALLVPTLLLVPPDSPMAPREEAVHNDLVRTVVVPSAGHCVRRPARQVPPGR